MQARGWCVCVHMSDGAGEEACSDNEVGSKKWAERGCGSRQREHAWEEEEEEEVLLTAYNE